MRGKWLGAWVPELGERSMLHRLMEREGEVWMPRRILCSSSGGLLSFSSEESLSV